MKRKKRVVFSGIGIISCIGTGKKLFWDNLFQGKSEFGEIDLFDVSNLKIKIAGQIRNFSAKTILGDGNFMDIDRASLLLLSAAKLAIDDACLEINESNTCKTGICVGTTFGSLNSISTFDREALREGPRFVNPSIFPSTVGNSPASRVAIRFKVKGFNTTISTGMSAGLDALDYSRDFIELGRADTVIAGSLESLSIENFLGFYKLGYLASLKDTTGEQISRPFDKKRNGVILAECASSLILQDAGLIQEKNPQIYGEILGIGSCSDSAKLYKYNPKGAGMKQAMNLALDDAECCPEDIDCIFANANSTQDADAIETDAIKAVFGSCAAGIPVTAVKSMVGETFSASGSLATIAALGAITKGIIPPTINYTHKDERCDLDYVPNQARKKAIKKVMINSFGPSGANTCLIIGEYN